MDRRVSGAALGVAFFLAAAIGFLLQPAAAAQATKNVEWARFDVAIEVRTDGTFHVIERQTVDFQGGPFRNGFAVIPRVRIEGIGNLQVGEDTNGTVQPFSPVEPENYKADAGTFTVEVTSTDVRIDYAFSSTTNRQRTFVLEYDVAGALRVYPDETPPNQQIRWTAIDSEVTSVAPVRESTVTVSLPQPVDPAQVLVGGDIEGEAGQYSTDGQTFTFTASGLNDGDDFVVGLQFPPVANAGAPSWQERDDAQRQKQEDDEERSALLNIMFLGAGLLLAVAGGAGVYGTWYARGRDPHAGLVADFLPAPPDDLPPGAAGALLDEEVHERDVVATLLDLGQRGVVKIEESESAGILGIGGSPDFTLTLLDPAKATHDLDQDLLKVLFGADMAAGQATKLSEARRRFDSYKDALADDLYGELVSRGYFTGSPKATRERWGRIGRRLMIASVVAGVVLLIAFSGSAVLVLIPIAVLLVLSFAMLRLGRAMPRKTQAGAGAAAKWAAFRRYLDDIEKYEDLGGSQEIFDRHLPYAVAFGLQEGWVGKFARVRAPTPAWFEGIPGGAFGGEMFDVGPATGRRRSRRGGTVWVGGGGFGGGSFDGGRSSGGGGGGFDFPDVDMPDMQDVSDRTGRGLQGSSDSLMGLLNVAGTIFGAMASGGGGRRGGGGFGGFSGGGGSGGSSGGGSRGFS